MILRLVTLAATLALIAAPQSVGSSNVSLPVVTVPLTVQNLAGSGKVTSDPAGIDCGSSCTMQVALGSQVTLTATPGPGASVHAWGGACTGTSTTCVVSVTAATDVTASFDPVRLTVTAQGSGGWVTSSGVNSPDGIDCGVGTTCSASFPIGTTLTLFAIRTETGALESWSNCPYASSVLCNITLTTDTSVTATFSIAALQIPVSIETDVDVSPGGAGTGDIAISPPGGTHCTSHCVRRYPVGVRLRLAANPTGGASFGGWTGGCGGASGTECSVGVVPGLSIGALFQLPPATAPPSSPSAPTQPPPKPPAGGSTGTGTGPVQSQTSATHIAQRVHVRVLRTRSRRTLDIALNANRGAVARISVRGQGASTLRKDVAIADGRNDIVIAIAKSRPPGLQRLTVVLRDVDGFVQTVTATVQLR
jgi:Divergent InlB B-repeat domain